MTDQMKTLLDVQELWNTADRYSYVRHMDFGFALAELRGLLRSTAESMARMQQFPESVQEYQERRMEIQGLPEAKREAALEKLDAEFPNALAERRAHFKAVDAKMREPLPEDKVKSLKIVTTIQRAKLPGPDDKTKVKETEIGPDGRPTAAIVEVPERPTAGDLEVFMRYGFVVP